MVSLVDPDFPYHELQQCDEMSWEKMGNPTGPGNTVSPLDNSVFTNQASESLFMLSTNYRG
jgi:hypothetical protein